MDRVDSDHICRPYQYFRSTLYEERITIYHKCDLLTDEILGLQRDNNSGKIDHDPSGINSKDQADAVCGSIYNASQHADEYAFDYGEDLDVTNELNTDISMNNQQQMIIDFEAEMMKLLDPVKDEVKKSSEQKNNYQANQAITTNAYLYDGIIVF